MPVYINSCRDCEWYLMAKKCLAFPKGIPDAIWTGKNDHKKPYNGDHDIQFKPLKDSNEES